jgi:hypothetical protein
MYPSKFTMWGLLVVTLAMAFWGSPALQAKDNDQHSCGCPAPVARPCCPAPVVRPCCPAPVVRPYCPAPVVRQKPAPTSCCPAPVVRQKPCGCCPVDPKYK